MKGFIYYLQFIRLIQLVGYLWLLGGQGLKAQPSITKTPQDSIKIMALNEQFAKALDNKQYAKATRYGKEALKTAKKQLYLEGKIQTLLLFGKLHTQTRQVSEALSYYLESESLCQSFNNQKYLVKIYDQLAGFYQTQNLYQKAIQYLRKAYTIRQKEKLSFGSRANVEQIAQGYLVLGDYPKAYVFYVKLLPKYRGDKEKQVQIRNQLALIASAIKNYSGAIAHKLKLLKHYQRQKDIAGISGTYNDLGFLYQRKRDLQTALAYFNLSSKVIQQQSSPSSNANQIVLLINTGVAYTNIEAFGKAKRYFRQALRIAQGQETTKAEILNYLASNYYLSGNSRQALVEVNKAIAIALPQKAWTVLLTSYDLLTRIYRGEGNKKKSQEFDGKYKALIKKLQQQKEQKLREVAYNLKLMEQQEGRIKSLLAEKRQLKELRDIQEKQKKDLALKSNLLVLQQKELALLKKAKELNQVNAKRALLEKVRQEQALLINQGKLREANLAKAKMLTALELERKETEKKLQEKENQQKFALLEKEKKIQQKEIKQQREKARYAIGIIVLVLGILGLVVLMLLIVNKNRHKLKKQKTKIEEQNTEILSQNEELYQQQEEIVAQRDNIEETNKLLNRQNQHIQQSIKAALTIQEAILPNPETVQALLPEHFILYKPKDVVSGDFYWLEQVDDVNILAAVDCTGHGVPGAFMSMIGSNLLNRIVLVHKIKNPKDILTMLNQEIEKVLRQKEKGYKNGMDLALIAWKQNSNQTALLFAGAKRQIYYLKNEHAEVLKIKGSRYSIGYADPIFEQKSFVIEKGDMLYLSSDGYVDQNNARRKKFGSKRFEKLLLEIQNLPLKKQEEVLSQRLEVHMTGVEQRDDILIIGIKF
ncbi:hypothetical protein BKI52_29480 [marine bacterium AO1-C]|nr:hypothetical protein BKI52_29480 [marine bacterium AO1-C]